MSVFLLYDHEKSPPYKDCETMPALSKYLYDHEKSPPYKEELYTFLLVSAKN